MFERIVAKLANVVTVTGGVGVEHRETSEGVGELRVGGDSELEISQQRFEAGWLERSPVVLEIKQLLVSGEMSWRVASTFAGLAVDNAVA